LALTINAGWSKDNAKAAMDTFIGTYGLPGTGKDTLEVASNSSSPTTMIWR
jgi:hypothetical protein